MKKFFILLFIVEILFTVSLLVVYNLNTLKFDTEIFKKNAEEYSVRIDRDIFGVPHVHGERDEDTAFGFGYAQTEDDLYHVEMMIKMARGEISDFNFSFSSLSTLYSLVIGEEVSLENILIKFIFLMTITIDMR
mgnify:CR=1 FL=1